MVPHQDSTFLYTEPPSITGLWVALEDATIENGCLWTLPGGHAGGIHKRFVVEEDGQVALKGEAASGVVHATVSKLLHRGSGLVSSHVYSSGESCQQLTHRILFVCSGELPQIGDEKFVPLEVKAGSLVVLHGANLHMSKENTSPASRHAYSVHYAEQGCAWAPQNW